MIGDGETPEGKLSTAIWRSEGAPWDYSIVHICDAQLPVARNDVQQKLSEYVCLLATRKSKLHYTEADMGCFLDISGQGAQET